MRRLAFGLAVIGTLIGGLAAGSARADVITTFNATGTFADGATLSGTVTIDSTTGVMTAADLGISAPDNLTLTNLYFQEANYPLSGIYEGAVNAGPTYPVLIFGMPVSTLDGYDGGDLLSTSQTTSGYTSALYLSSTDINPLSQGTLSPVPEPSSIVVLSTAALMFVATVGWRRAGL